MEIRNYIIPCLVAAWVGLSVGSLFYSYGLRPRELETHLEDLNNDGINDIILRNGFGRKIILYGSDTMSAYDIEGNSIDVVLTYESDFALENKLKKEFKEEKKELKDSLKELKSSLKDKLK